MKLSKAQTELLIALTPDVNFLRREKTPLGSGTLHTELTENTCNRSVLPRTFEILLESGLIERRGGEEAKCPVCTMDGHYDLYDITPAGRAALAEAEGGRG
uniref:Uncharacterized protein n=1 Tax=viral metagenome TaxID=1070528 RepID=A0A6M3LMI1_9ZZZZ